MKDAGGTGGKPVVITDAAEARDFRRDQKTLFTVEKRFSSEARFKQYQDRKHFVLKKNVPSTPKQDNDFELDPASAEKVQAMVVKEMPSNAIVGHFLTTNRSKQCFLVIEFKDDKGNQFWCIKPEYIFSIFNSYSKVKAYKNAFICEALANAKPIRMKDPNGGPNQQARTDPPKKEGKTGNGFDIFLLATRFTIPHESFTSEDDEKEWLGETTALILNYFQSVMKSQSFIRVLEKRCGPTKFFSSIMAENVKYTTYPEYLDSCRINVNAFNKDKSLVVLDDMRDMSQVLFEHNLKNRRKYPLTEAEKRMEAVELVESDGEDDNVQYEDDDDMSVEQNKEDDSDDDDKRAAANDHKQTMQDGEESDATDEDSDDDNNGSRKSTAVTNQKSPPNTPTIYQLSAEQEETFPEDDDMNIAAMVEQNRRG